MDVVLSFLKNQNGDLFADIGSDHAFLAIEALKSGAASNAIASDINQMPLQKGKENAEREGLDIEFVLSDGFDKLEGRDITAAAICGMGGELIAKMVLRSEVTRKCSLILQPMTAQEELRRILWENGFEISDECFVCENKKAYVVMLVKYTGATTGYDYCDLYLGKVRPDSEAFAKYCEKLLSGALKRRLGIVARGESVEDIDRLISICQAQMTKI